MPTRMKIQRKKKKRTTSTKKAILESNLPPVNSIRSVNTSIIFDNYGFPAFEVELTMYNGINTKASVPTTGIALEDSLGCVAKIAFYVNTEIAPLLVGKDPTKQLAIDKLMTMLLHEQQQQAFLWVCSNLPWECIQNLFRNAIFAVSLAVCKAGASFNNLHLTTHIANLASNKVSSIPIPVLNVMKSCPCPNTRDQVDAQEEWIPLPRTRDFGASLGKNLRIRQHLRTQYSSKFGQDLLLIENMEEALEILNTTLDKLGLTGQVYLGLERVGAASASTVLFDKFNFISLKEQDKDIDNDNDRDAFKEVLKSFIRGYPITKCYYPFGQHDLEFFHRVCAARTGRLTRDEFATFEEEAAGDKKKNRRNGLLIKMNKIGSVTECIAAVEMTKKAGWASIMATYRCGSGETSDTSLADLSMALSVNQIRFGGLNKLERRLIFSRIMAISEEFFRKYNFGGVWK